MRANREAFRRWRIVPRMLEDVSERDLSTTVLGTAMPAPVLLAPVGVQSIVHPDGELASARAAASLGVPYVASTAASHPLEDIAGAAATARWYQLYWPRGEELAASLVHRAEEAGYGAGRHAGHLRCWAGARATSTAPTCRSCRASASPTT